MQLGDNYQLLITKEVFKIEQDKNRLQLPFQQTYIFSDIPQDCLTYKWPFSNDEKSENAMSQPKENPVSTQEKETKEKTITFNFKEIIPSEESV